jgi:hypothetical protein
MEKTPLFQFHVPNFKFQVKPGSHDLFQAYTHETRNLKRGIQGKRLCLPGAYAVRDNPATGGTALHLTHSSTPLSSYSLHSARCTLYRLLGDRL